MTSEWNIETLSYAAGFLDGDGCFFTHKKGNSFKIAVSCSNADKKIVKWFQNKFGGSISKGKRKRKENHRQIWQWTIVSNDAYKFCRHVVPFLKIKDKQACLLISIQQTSGMRKGKFVDPEIVKERERLNEILKQLKKEKYEED